MKKISKYPNAYITVEHEIILTLTAFMLIFFSSLSFSYAAASSQSIPDAIKKFAKNKKRMRIAVFDFANTSGEKTRFDGYIADTIVSELSKYSSTLLERKRLKMLLKEHALSPEGPNPHSEKQSRGFRRCLRGSLDRRKVTPAPDTAFAQLAKPGETGSFAPVPCAPPFLFNL